MKLTNEANMTWSNACAARDGTNSTWKIPTKDEWPMIAGSLGIGTDYNTQYGLIDLYWSSTERYWYNAWIAYFIGGKMFDHGRNDMGGVRLCTTF